MSEPYIGEIKMVSFNFAPKFYAMCNGQLLSIAQNAALFSILGTTYGGNGTQNFALPDLRGRTPVHYSPITFSPQLGESAGVENHTLILNEIPSHSHTLSGSTGGTASRPGTSVLPGTLPGSQPPTLYATGTASTMNSGGITNSGGNQAHNNMQPCLVLNFVVALNGVFPSRS